MSSAFEVPCADEKLSQYLPMALLMWLVYVIHGIDRSILNVLLSPIQQEFALSDSQIGLLSGVAYAIPFALAGIPLGALADRTTRKNLLASLLAIWSVFTIVSGMVHKFWALALARGIVGAAEGGGPPTMISLLSDSAPPKYRPAVMSIFFTGPFCGIFLGSLIAGYASQIAGWRTALFIAGVPGLLIAAFIFFAVKEPKRGAFDAPSTGDEQALSILQSLKALFENNQRGALTAAIVLSAFVSIAINAWLAIFFVRVHDYSMAQTGAISALILGVFGGAGAILSGAIATRYGKGNQQWILKWCAVTMLLSVPAAILAIVSVDARFGIVGLGIWSMLSTAYLGPGYSALTTALPASIRATAIGGVAVLANLLGAGLGPQAVGIISDTLSVGDAADNLRAALASVTLVSLLPAYFFYRSSQSSGLSRQSMLELKAAGDEQLPS